MNAGMKKTIYVIVAGFFFTVLLEAFLFNYRYYLTAKNEETEFEIQYGSGLKKTSEGQFEVVDENDTAIILNGFSEEINCLRMDMEKYDFREKKTTAVTAEIYATDEANTVPMNLGKREVYGNAWRSQYAYLHLAGKSNMVKIVPKLAKGDVLSIHHIVLNARIPFGFMWQRALLVFGIFLLIYALRPGSVLYTCKFDSASRFQRGVTAIFVISASLLFVKMAFANPIYVNPPWSSHQEYQRLAEALADGHFYLNEEPPAALKEMANPYDKYERIKVMEETNSSFLWDHAYYEGKYYVYFGIVPELIFYLPCYLITHQHMKTVWAIGICGILIILAVTRLVKQILERWFPDTSYAVYLLMCGTFLMSMGLVYCASHAGFYSLPIMLAVFFGIMGISCWLQSLREGQISGGYLFLGSLCMALIAGCRPQLLLIALIVFPFFWKRTVRERQLFSAKTAGKTIGFLAPFVVVAVFLMYYNFARFGSVFDFGANYNLTSNDMTSRFASIHLCLEGIFVFFFQPASIGMVFPFLQAAPSQYSYLGNNIHEVMYGGFFVCNAVSWTALKFGSVKDILKKKKLLGLCILFAVIAGILAVVDIIGAGILPRYLTDFSWLILLAVTLVVFALEEYFAESSDAVRRKRWRMVFLSLCILTVSYQVMAFFASGDSYLNLGNPDLYYKIYYAAAFWM